jgi:hypothetical protein
MNLSKIAATGGIAGALSFAALGLGTGLAHADNDDQPLPPGPGWNGQGSDLGHDSGLALVAGR